MAYIDEVLADSPAHLWPMTESSGALADEIASLDLSPNGTPTYGLAGPTTGLGAIDFSGDDYFTNAGLGSIPTGTAAFSWEFFYKGTLTTRQYMISYGAFATRQSMLFGIENAASRFILYGTNDDRAHSAHGMNDGDWHHVVFTKAESASVVNLYVDGNYLGPLTFSDVLNIGTTYPLTIGKRFATAENFVVGALSGVAVYPTVLSATRIRAHFDATNLREATADLVYRLTPTITQGTYTSLYGGSDSPAAVTDGSDATFIVLGESINYQEFQWDLGEAKALATLRTKSGWYDQSQYSPMSVQVHGSNDGSAWTTLYNLSAENLLAGRSITLTSPGAYRYVRVGFSGNGGKAIWTVELYGPMALGRSQAMVIT